MGVLHVNLESICYLSLLVNLAQRRLMCLKHTVVVDFNSGIEKLCNIIDRDRMAAKRQGLMTDYFSNQSCE